MDAASTILLVVALEAVRGIRYLCEVDLEHLVADFGQEATNVANESLHFVGVHHAESFVFESDASRVQPIQTSLVPPGAAAILMVATFLHNEPTAVRLPEAMLPPARPQLGKEPVTGTGGIEFGTASLGAFASMTCGQRR